MTEQCISIERMEEAINLFGLFDENIRIIEQELGVTVVNRESNLKISGDGEAVMWAVKAVQSPATKAATRMATARLGMARLSQNGTSARTAQGTT